MGTPDTGMVKKSATQPSEGEARQTAQIVVLGMHRSGTSAITAALAGMGAFVGEEEALTAKNWENPLGFFERRDARAICDGVLHDCGADWWKVTHFDPNRIPNSVSTARNPEIRALVGLLNEGAAQSRVWAVKEPRLCLMLPLFRRHLVNPHIVMMARHPLEVAQSLRRRNGFPISAGLALWEAYNVAAISGLEGVAPAIVQYDQLVSTPEQTLQKLADELSAGGVSGLDVATGKENILTDLRRESAEGYSGIQTLSAAQSELWEVLSRGGPLPTRISLSEEAKNVLLDFEMDETSRQKTLSELKEVKSKLKASTDAAENLKQAQKSLKSGENQIATLTADVATKDQKIVALTKDLTDKSGHVAALSKDLADATKQVSALTNDLTDRNGQIAALTKELTARNEQSALQKRDLAAANEQLANANKQLAGLKANISGLTGEIQELRKQISQTESHRDQSIANAKSLDKQKRTLEVALRDVIKTRDDLKLEAAGYTAELKALRKTTSALATITQRLERAEKENSELKTALSVYQSNAARDVGLKGWLRGLVPGSRAAALRADLGSVGAREITISGLQFVGQSDQILLPPPPRPASRRRVSPRTLALAPMYPIVWWRQRHSRRQLELVRSSGLFDQEFYLNQYADVRGFDAGALQHYMQFGWKEGRVPGRSFDPSAYLAANEDLDPYTVNPLLHYIMYGRAEGRPLALQGPPATGLPALKVGQLSSVDIRIRKTAFGKRLSEIMTGAGSEKLSKALTNSEARIERSFRKTNAGRATPLISVIMPTWNRASIISEAIQSVVEQEYANWELLVCDDASDDNTEEVVASFNDTRIRYMPLPKGGAAAARNAGLREARGELIAYLDSDNIWHPAFLLAMTGALQHQPGRSAAYCDFIDFNEDAAGEYSVRSFERPAFSQEKLLNKNFIDLNAFVHRRELYDCFGGFNEALTRRQDYDLIIKYTWLRDPIRVQCILALYRRSEKFVQITTAMRDDESCIPIIQDAISTYLKDGLPLSTRPHVKKVTIISWDLSRNHFSKPFALAEALAKDYEVQLISFRFFEEFFPPLKDVQPSFETVYIDGADFPDFFAAMRRALDAITGDIIYVVKPRLPSLGLALLANADKGTPIVLEINDLETVVSKPSNNDVHQEVLFADTDLGARELLNPYSDLWSQLMDPVAKQIPVLLTHNKGIDEHFGKRCLYMRNLKDDAVYDPARYDREAVRAEFGIAPEDRVILFGGLLRKHKGIYELVELVDRLADPRYKLLFVGSRVTPDQERLMKEYGDQIRVLPPQDREAMARINLASDLVILWLDPDVPASHYQMPYKATDAFAMGPAVIANNISDLGALGKQGYLRIVPFGDWDGMAKAVRAVFEEPARSAEIQAAARRLYQRQFSYPAARGSFALAAARALNAPLGPLPVAREFAGRFNEFHRKLTQQSADFVPLKPPSAAAGGEIINVITLDDLPSLSWKDKEGIAVIMPCIDTERGRKTAELLCERAGTPLRIFVVEDIRRQGFIRTLNETAARLDVKYVVYLAEDAYPGLDWLKIARSRLDETGKGLLAFNCGKWHGRIAAFGMVRKAWAAEIYGDAILHPGYRAHKADNEITVIARVKDQFVYQPDAVLVEYDLEKFISGEGGAAQSSWEEDKLLFDARFHDSFDKRVSWPDLARLKQEYLDQTGLKEAAGDVRYVGGQDEIKVLDVDRLEAFFLHDPEGIAVVMPAIDLEKAGKAATFLQHRAGVPAKYLIVEDTKRQGFIRTLNETVGRLDVKYVVYLAEDAYPGTDWLRIARERLDRSGKGLLAFNCGKWRGRIAAFGMARMDWVKTLYGGAVFFEGYKAHKADNEITVIARAQDAFVYDANSVLVEYDPNKVFVDKVKEDRTIFRNRFRSGFDGTASMEFLKEHAAEYFVNMDEQIAPESLANPSPDDTFIYYRIIGNDLYPRHKRGQSLENIKFILDHEPALEGCHKKFIVNRIFDKENEASIIDLLNARGQDYLIIPFDAQEYQRIGFDVDGFGEPGFLSSKKFESFEKAKRVRVETSVYRRKNAYVMNNNGARNAALKDGRGRARWVMPWDGNCFLTQEAWDAIRSTVLDAPDCKYFIVPMARVLNNNDLVNGSVVPDPVEEPQIIFRQDAAERFNESFVYGRRPKVELLWRLGVSGKWDAYKDDLWDAKRRPRSPEATFVRRAGWVARLFSGQSSLETDDTEAELKRAVVRTEAIISTLQALDAATAGASSERQVSINERVLEIECESALSEHVLGVRAQLIADADDALMRGPYSVRDKTTLPPSGNPQDYWHPAPYWWPDPKKPDGLPYIRKDGERVPGTEMYERASEKYDRTRLQRVFDDSLVLALAGKFSDKRLYGEHGAAILDRFFLNPETRMNPHLKYGQVRMGHNKNQGAPTGLIEMKDLYFYLDAVRMFHAAGTVSDDMKSRFCAWLEEYMAWLLSSDQGTSERVAINNHGTCYDLQVASIAAYLGNEAELYGTLARAQSRIAQQFAPDGRQPDELKRKTTAHYCCFNMQSWINLAALAQRWGVDLWTYTAPNGASLRGGASWLLSHMGKPWPYEQIDAFDADRFLPIWFAASKYIKVPPALELSPYAIYDIKPVFFPHDGIRPFWNIGNDFSGPER